MGQPVPDNQSAGYTRRCTLNGNLDESSILSTSTKQEQAPWETGGLLLWRAAGFFCILVWPQQQPCAAAQASPPGWWNR